MFRQAQFQCYNVSSQRVFYDSLYKACKIKRIFPLVLVPEQSWADWVQEKSSKTGFVPKTNNSLRDCKFSRLCRLPPWGFWWRAGEKGRSWWFHWIWGQCKVLEEQAKVHLNSLSYGVIFGYESAEDYLMLSDMLSRVLMEREVSLWNQLSQYIFTHSKEYIFKSAHMKAWQELNIYFHFLETVA